jgi:hypothetical protein
MLVKDEDKAGGLKWFTEWREHIKTSNNEG